MSECQCHAAGTGAAGRQATSDKRHVSRALTLPSAALLGSAGRAVLLDRSDRTRRHASINRSSDRAAAVHIPLKSIPLVHSTEHASATRRDSTLCATRTPVGQATPDRSISYRSINQDQSPASGDWCPMYSRANEMIVCTLVSRWHLGGEVGGWAGARGGPRTVCAPLIGRVNGIRKCYSFVS